MKKLLFALAMVTLSACEDATPPHFVYVCVETATTMEMQYVPFKVMQFGTVGVGDWRFRPVSKCVRSESRCAWGRDYKGLKECRS